MVTSGQRLRAWGEALWAGQRDTLICWVPVVIATGIAGYFQLRSEPALNLVAAVFAAGCVVLGLSWRRADLRPLGVAVFLLTFGFGLAALRAHMVSGPVLGFRYYGAVEGRIVGMDRSASDALRITLDQVVLSRMAPDRTPKRVRVALYGPPGTELIPGKRVILTANLSPPNGAAQPGGFDFRRHAWFQSLGAVGYTRMAVLATGPPDGARLLRLRLHLAERIRAALPGDQGAFAAAVMTGDRSAMQMPVLNALRDTNLAHLLAISGLHMGLLAGLVFGALRLGFAWPGAVWGWPARRIAAAGAFVAAACYLSLSGGNVATERAFIMASVGLTAVWFNRRVLSLRVVALAALLVLLRRPEALLSPGFQMSFAATTGLVAVFGALRDHPVLPRGRWISPVLSVVISSAVAGLATSPVGLAHFNQAAHYGLLANVISVPIMGLVVMPCAILTGLLFPLGLEAWGLALMQPGLAWILGVAQTVADWPGAVSHVPAPPGLALPLIAIGALIVILWQGRARWSGALLMAAAVAGWGWIPRPDLLVASDARLVAVREDGRLALSREKGAGFVAGIWLENDGDPSSQRAAAARWTGGQGQVLHLATKRAVGGFTGCRAGQILVTVETPASDLPCQVFEAEALKLSGAIAGYHGPEGWRFVSVRDVEGQRLWHPKAFRRPKSGGG